MDTKQLLIVLASFISGTTISIICIHSTLSVIVAFGTVLPLVVGLVIGKHISERKSDFYQPKMMFQGNVNYITPDIGYTLIQSAMERCGFEKEGNR